MNIFASSVIHDLKILFRETLDHLVKIVIEMEKINQQDIAESKVRRRKRKIKSSRKKAMLNI